jgi:ELWxxDGT repeat protein
MRNTTLTVCGVIVSRSICFSYGIVCHAALGCEFSVPCEGYRSYLHVCRFVSRCHRRKSLGTFFTATISNLGSELWITDGTEEGTRLVKDIHPGWQGSNIVGGAVAADGTLIFAANDGHGDQVWRSDGTKIGTFALTPASGSAENQARAIVRHGDFVYFFFFSQAGAEIWRTNGSLETTQPVTTIHNFFEPGLLTSVNENLLVFIARPLGGSTSSVSLFAWNGIDERANVPTLGVPSGHVRGFGWRALIGMGTIFSAPMARPPEQIHTSTPSYAQPASVTSLVRSLFFPGWDSSHGVELWTSDGPPLEQRSSKTSIRDLSLTRHRPRPRR